MSSALSNKNNEESAIFKIDQASNTENAEKQSPIKITIGSPQNNSSISPRIPRKRMSHSQDVSSFIF